MVKQEKRNLYKRKTFFNLRKKKRVRTMLLIIIEAIEKKVKLFKDNLSIE
jgi:hypothetical protein